MNTAPKDEISLGQLFSNLAEETRTLIKQEVQLAKVELSEKAAETGKNIGFIGAGGVLVHVGLLTLIAAICISLGHQIGYATATFIMAFLVLAVGIALALNGKARMNKTSLSPDKTKSQLKETTQWAKEQMR